MVTNPELPGPEVAFNQDDGPGGLQLAGWLCDPANQYLRWGGPYAQAFGVWRTVADGVAAYTTFCVVTRSSDGYGEFGGTLAWD